MYNIFKTSCIHAQLQYKLISNVIHNIHAAQMFLIMYMLTEQIKMLFEVGILLYIDQQVKYT